nr:transposase family protein [Methylocystis rosea]
MVSSRNQRHAPKLAPSAFVPAGFHVENAIHDGAVTIITVRPTSKSSRCPTCTADAERIHSRYLRRLADLPLTGRQVRLVVIARRFRCDAASCRCAIFTERFSANILAPRARRTARLDCLVHHLSMARARDRQIRRRRHADESAERCAVKSDDLRRMPRP